MNIVRIKCFCVEYPSPANRAVPLRICHGLVLIAAVANGRINSELPIVGALYDPGPEDERENVKQYPMLGTASKIDRTLLLTYAGRQPETSNLLEVDLAVLGEFFIKSPNGVHTGFAIASIEPAVSVFTPWFDGATAPVRPGKYFVRRKDGKQTLPVLIYTGRNWTALSFDNSLDKFLVPAAKQIEWCGVIEDLWSAGGKLWLPLFRGRG